MKLCGYEVGIDQPFFLIAGPCVIESEQLVLDIATQLAAITDELQIPFIFKASYDKANRTSSTSFRGPGIEKGLAIGGHVGKRFLPIWLQQASASVEKGLLRDGLSLDLAADTSVDFVLGQLGHPRYKGPRYTQYKTKGLVRSPYETLF